MKHQSVALDLLSRKSKKLNDRWEKRSFNSKTSKTTEKENQNWMQAYIVSFFASDTVALANWNKMIFKGNKLFLSSLCKEVLVRTSLWCNVSKLKNKSRFLFNGQCYLQKRCLLFEGPMGRGLLFVMDFWRVALWALLIHAMVDII